MRFGTIVEWNPTDVAWVARLMYLGTDDRDRPVWITVLDSDPDHRSRWESGFISAGIPITADVTIIREPT